MKIPEPAIIMNAITWVGVLWLWYKLKRMGYLIQVCGARFDHIQKLEWENFKLKWDNELLTARVAELEILAEINRMALLPTTEPVTTMCQFCRCIVNVVVNGATHDDNCTCVCHIGMEEPT